MEEKPKLEENIRVRLVNGTKQKIKKITNANPERFTNESHFVRVAVLRLIRECEQHGE